MSGANPDRALLVETAHELANAAVPALVALGRLPASDVRNRAMEGLRRVLAHQERIRKHLDGPSVRDLTEYVLSLHHCPDGHFWECDAQAVRTRVENIADPGMPPLYLWRAFAVCPRCAFEQSVEARDATEEEIAAHSRGDSGP